MRLILIIAVLMATFAMNALNEASMAAQSNESTGAGHTLVGSWLVVVEIEGQPPLRLPNLASFTADGVVIVSAPTLLPELPGGDTTRDVFSTGHGAWTAAGDRGADVRFVFLVVDERGNPDSINLIDGTLQVDAGGNAYTGQFTLTIVPAAGHAPAPVAGTWRATRIAVGAETVAPPMSVDAIATPAATPAA
jgi:hypothetical protein